MFPSYLENNTENKDYMPVRWSDNIFVQKKFCSSKSVPLTGLRFPVEKKNKKYAVHINTHTKSETKILRRS